MKIVAFSKNLIYGVGGAERSILEELKKLPSSYNVTLASVNGVKSFNAQNLKLKLPTSFDISLFEPHLLVDRFFYNEYLFNRKTIKKFIVTKCADADELWAQNIWAPAAINNFTGKTVYFARDETFLNVRPNYYYGAKRYAKKVYDLIDSPGFISYCRDNRLAIESADEVISSSQFMAEEIKNKYGRDSKVIYPFIDKEALVSNYEGVKFSISEDNKGVVLLGDALIKGIEVFHKLAGQFPNELFYVFCRDISEPITKQNITYMPWVKSPVEAYKYAKVVIAPSLCQEAYGRVAAEAIALGIPCLVNDIGGLPEAVEHNDSMIARGYEDFSLKLKNLLKQI